MLYGSGSQTTEYLSMLAADSYRILLQHYYQTPILTDRYAEMLGHLSHWQAVSQPGNNREWLQKALFWYRTIEIEQPQCGKTYCKLKSPC